MTPRGAAFLDRDGTIIEDTDYLKDPEDVRLLPGAAEAIRELNARDIPVIIATNQSGIARGLLTRDDYEAVRRRLDAMLAAEGARIDASYVCPHHPDVGGPCECRKPGTGMYVQAIAERDLDGAASVWIGDRWRDVAPARAFGGRGILIPSPRTPADERERAGREMEEAASLLDAVRRVLAADTLTARRRPT